MDIPMPMLRFAALFCLLAWALTACNTMEGLGRDVQSGGQALENSADKTQKKM
jgi:entericidin B